jgi:5'(3')-deoxyribonucleotidase
VADFVLGVDLDGVCADHAEAFRRVVAAERGLEPGELSPQQSWDFVEWGLERGDFEALHKRAVLEHRMFRTMPVVPGAAEALWRLSDAGVWIRLITHRLYTNWGHAVAVADTVAWLDEHAIPYRDLCFLGDKPQVEADAYLDDAVHNVEALRATGAAVCVFDQPYNADLPGPRAVGWAEAEQWVLDLMAARGHAVQPQFALADDPTARLRRPSRPTPPEPERP